MREDFIRSSACGLTRSARLFSLGCLLLAVACEVATAADASGTRATPNIVLIFADDLGYGDLGIYGAEGNPTPHLDNLARAGMRFTDFYVPQPVCSASRAAILTGCYPNRIGIVGALGPNAKHGIHDEEVTLAEICKSRGYATAIYGKWHLGHHPQFLPTRHGFDEYYGLPYSNDMWPHHPTAGRNYPQLPLIEGEKTIALNPDQTQLTTAYTERAVRFIERNANRPFFLYVAHSMPHVPLFVSAKHAGVTKRGLYGDVIAEIDWSVGQILESLAKHDLDGNTIVIFASDNGPWLLYGDHAGSSGPLREGKATTWEGGIRTPCILRWPGQVPADSVCREPVMSIDLLPTIAAIIGADLPAHRIDGRDIGPLWRGTPNARSPHAALYFYWLNELQAVRSGKWKLHVPHTYPKPAPAGGAGKPGKYSQEQTGLALYDLEADRGETTNLADQHPEIVERLQRLLHAAREDLGDSARKQQGANLRAPGRL